MLLIWVCCNLEIAEQPGSLHGELTMIRVRIDFSSILSCPVKALLPYILGISPMP
ncbi:MAG: hypothetical protein ACI89J_003045 [Hyphomicrobiaceae bacterium]|jgi:hypothetical protein